MLSGKRITAAITALFFFMFICPASSLADVTKHKPEDRALVIKDIPAPKTEEGQKPEAASKAEQRGWFSKHKWTILAGVLVVGGIAAAMGGGGGGGDSGSSSDGDTTTDTGSATVYW